MQVRWASQDKEITHLEYILCILSRLWKRNEVLLQKKWCNSRLEPPGEVRGRDVQESNRSVDDCRTICGSLCIYWNQLWVGGVVRYIWGSDVFGNVDSTRELFNG